MRERLQILCLIVNNKYLKDFFMYFILIIYQPVENDVNKVHQ